MVIAGDFAAVRTGINNFRIARIRRNVAALAAAYGIPTCAVNSAWRRAGNGHGRVVLLRSVEVIRKTIVGDYVIELRCRLVGLPGPTGAAIRAYVGSAVIGTIHPSVQHINAVGVARIGKNMGVIKRALAILAITVGERPCIAAIVRAEEPTFIGFHQSPYAVAAIRDSQPDASQGSIRQSMTGEMFPRRAAIGAAIEPASGPAAVHSPGRAPRLP